MLLQRKRRSFQLLVIALSLITCLIIGCDTNSKTKLTLIMQVDGQGSVTPSAGRHYYEIGVVVDLQAYPDQDWAFSGWIGEVSNLQSSTTTIMMYQDQIVTAVFLEESYQGEQTSHNVNGMNFNMRLAPASTFPTGINDQGSASVDHDFWIAETQVTYELWYTVRMWALNNGYTFTNAGMEGSNGAIGGEPSERKNEPVTMVNWYNSIVWCNALSEYLGYTPVYFRSGSVIKSARGIDHTEVEAEHTSGFRLPTSKEWELAARYKGGDSSHGAIRYPDNDENEKYWSPGSYASGAKADYTHEDSTKDAAWYLANSGGETKNVGQRPLSGNGLGVFDMSGNVYEWCFAQSGTYQVNRGGSSGNSAYDLQVGLLYTNVPSSAYILRGFRLARAAQQHF